MLAADARLEPGSRLSPVLHRHLDQLAHAGNVEHLEGIVGEDPFST